MNILAVDIGGSSFKTGLFQKEALISFQEYKNDGRLGASHLISHLLSVIGEYTGPASPDAIGLSVTGQIDSQQGKVVFATDAIPGFTGTWLRDVVMDKTGLPVVMENDVNCAALGEAFYGAGQPFSDFLCLTYGTGIGGAIILNHRIFHGLNGIAGEFGHMVLHRGGEPCVCGRSGCYETYASTTALCRMVSQKTGEQLSGREIFARFDNPEIKKIIDHWIDEIAEGLISLLHIFNPPAILLGGGIMKQQYVYEELQKRVLQRVLPSFRQTKILQTLLENQAGMYGAFHLASLHRD
ncbi:MAG: ROK family protein [Lachnospiraceae bacterium]|nr:ROK family protein [Lachnospiraceae bacterium]